MIDLIKCAECGAKMSDPAAAELHAAGHAIVERAFRLSEEGVAYADLPDDIRAVIAPDEYEGMAANPLLRQQFGRP